MDKLNTIVEMWIKDSQIDETNLVSESLKIPSLHSKYLKLLVKEKLILSSIKVNKTELSQTLQEYYKGDLNNPDDLSQIKREPFAKKLLKQDVHNYVEADKEMVNSLIKIAIQQEIVDALTEIIKSINTRNFVIKNAIDYMKFINGGS
jgi:hypothetical protein